MTPTKPIEPFNEIVNDLIEVNPVIQAELEWYDKNEIPRSFFLRDLFYVMDDENAAPILHVQKLIATPRGQGLGTQYLQRLIQQYPNHIITLQAGVLHNEYPGLHDQDVPDVTHRLANFYVRLGFQKIETKNPDPHAAISLIYPNAAAKAALPMLFPLKEPQGGITPSV